MTLDVAAPIQINLSNLSVLLLLLAREAVSRLDVLLPLLYILDVGPSELLLYY